MIIIGSDHAGFKLKGRIISYLRDRRIKTADAGNFSAEPADYPDVAQKVARKVKAAGAKGILICGTGIGVCIAANRIRGIRAALCYDAYTAKMARADDDANILCLGARNTSTAKAIKVVRIFLSTRFSGAARHRRRIRKLG